VLEQNNYIQELRAENEYIPQLSAKVKEFTLRIEQISKEVDKEKMKNERIVNEKVVLEDKLEEIQVKYSGRNSIEYLNSQIEEQKNYVKELENEKRCLQNRIKELEDQFQKEEKDYYEELESIIEGLRFLLEYLELSFANIRETDVKHPLKEPQLWSKNNAINSCIDKLKNFIKGIKEGVAKSWEGLENENINLKKLLAEIQTTKDSLVNEVKNLKIIIESQENKIKNIQGKKDTDEVVKELYAELLRILSFQDIPLSYSNNNKRSHLMKLMRTVEDAMTQLNTQVKVLSNKTSDLTEQNVILKAKEEALNGEIKRVSKEYKNKVLQLEDDLRAKQEYVSVL